MRDMSASDFWKNFRLGEEVHIAGMFIYNGLRRFHELQLLDHSDELFEFLYNLSIGIERLLKIAVVLHEHTAAADQDALERSLITHNHLDLLVRVRKHVSINFGKPQNELLQLLSAFYKTLRYDRFTLNSAYKGSREAEAVRKLLSKHLRVEFPERDFLLGTTNEDRYRSFISRTVLKISQTIYKIIDDRSSALGLYTYELRHGSKAESVFLRAVKIGDEDMLWKELLIFFMSVDPSTGYLKFLKGIEPLGFDPALVSDYLDCFKSDASKAAVMDELEFHYDEMDPEKRKQRLEMMGVIGAPAVYFYDNDEDEPLEDDDNT
ncbi:F-box domain-containing protein [Pseudomonas chlororaphis]